jgi:cyclopropane-fatty-acyl-phospholipid synthase
MKKEKEIVASLFEEAGIELNGESPVDIKVHNPNFYRRVLAEGSLGLGESYMEGWWDVGALDEFANRILRASLHKKIKNWRVLPYSIAAIIFNHGRKSNAFVIGNRHYDIDNNLFKKMLDKRMVYSCGYWKDAGTLDEAQEAKLELVSKKLSLNPGMKVFDIGCGWGSFCTYAAEKYGTSAVGVTVSKEQVALGSKLCKGLPVKVRLQDYREIEEEEYADRVVSIGMFEHVGYKNYRSFMKVAHRLLKKGGLFLLQTVGGNESALTIDPWMGKYIFPNSMVPSIKQIGASIEGLFVMEDWQSFSSDYDKTLMSWFRNFDTSWSELKSQFSEVFYRMWKYYLLVSAGAFRSRYNQLWQIVLSKKGCSPEYSPIR